MKIEPSMRLGAPAPAITCLDDVLKFRQPAAFGIGDMVRIKFDWQYHGKSLRRDLLEKLCAQWQLVKLTNDPTYSKKGSKREAADYLLKKRVCLGKISAEFKKRVRDVMALLDAEHQAFVYMVEPRSSNGLSNSMCSNSCYLDGSYSKVSLIRYAVLIVGAGGKTYTHWFMDYQLEKLV